MKKLFWLFTALLTVITQFSQAQPSPRLEIKPLDSTRVQLSWTNAATGFVVDLLPTS